MQNLQLGKAFSASRFLKAKPMQYFLPIAVVIKVEKTKPLQNENDIKWHNKVIFIHF